MSYIGEAELSPSFVSWDRVEKIDCDGIMPWLCDGEGELDASERVAFLPYGRKPCLRLDLLSLLDQGIWTSAEMITYLDGGMWSHMLPWMESMVFVVRSEEEKMEVEARLATVQNSGWREKSSVVLEER